jgi:hypothetical protein
MPDTAKASHNWRGHDLADASKRNRDFTEVIVAGAFKPWASMPA